MQLKASQLREHLKKGIQPIYFIYGDEPLQLRNYTDMVRKAAIYYGYDERERYTADNQFNWAQLAESACSLSLFSSKKLIEIHLPSAKPGDKGAKAIINYCDNIPDDTILLLFCGKLESASQRSKWFKRLDQVAWRVTVYPFKENELKSWITSELFKNGLQISSESLMYFVDHIEGNMLSADQEITKLALLYNANKQQAQNISHEQLVDAIHDNTLYKPFELFDTVLRGESKHAMQMLKQFEQDGTALIFLLFIISKELRLCANIANFCQQMPLPQAMQKEYIFPQRKALIQSVLSQFPMINWQDYLLQLIDIERIAKGMASEQSTLIHPWNCLLKVLLEISHIIEQGKNQAHSWH